jgi:hypothetical protein
MENYKTLRYGISDFRSLIQKNGYFVDKTPYIQRMEKKGDFLILLRPRRFGKSLFLSMLRYYYDIKERDHFASLFQGTWIADHPTPERGTYQVLALDFSMLNTTAHDLPEKFNDYCCAKVDDFMDSYKEFYPEHVFQKISECPSFDGKLNRINNYAKRNHIPLCLIVDEYDNFTNTILASQGHGIYHEITHADGFYREMFKLFKGMFDRIVLTGVSPVTLDDLSSGYNIAENVTQSEVFNQILGFSAEEVRQMIRYYRDHGVIHDDEDKMMAEMTAWYDGYCFSTRAVEQGEKVFNSTMVIKYIKNYIDEGHAPDNLLDPNTRTDYAKLHQLLRLDSLNGNRRSVLMQIAQDGCTTGEIVDSFPASRLTDPNIFTSLLYYYGMLSIKGMDSAYPVLGIPNNNVRIQYYNYLMEEYNRIQHVDTSLLNSLYQDAALNGQWRPMVEFLCRAYHENSSVRCLIEGERNVQGFMMGYLSLNPYYLTAPEVEVNHGYCDFFLMPNTLRQSGVAHSYIIELKYLAVGDSAEKAEAQWREAEAQLCQYIGARQVQLLRQGTQLHGLIVQVKGSELLRTEEVNL